MTPSRKTSNAIFATAAALALCLVAALGALAQKAPAQKPWDGPVSGPVRQAGKKITYISQDFKNGGISANYRSFSSAARELGWELTVVNGNSDTQTIRTAFEQAIHIRQDAIVLGGFQIDESLADVAERARQAKIVLVGWHAAAEPGPARDLFVNVATESSDVARMAADYVIQSTGGDIGVIIFNDNRFDVANAKTNGMKEVIQQCKRCRLLAVENIFISNAVRDVPDAVRRLNKTWGRAWTHTLAINDVYFDAMNVPLATIGREDIRNVAAGDGSNNALGRIKSGLSQQIATVAEPTGLQGWQLADELNRAFAGSPASGYVSKPILVTTQFLAHVGNAGIDEEIPYKQAYTAIWQGKRVDR
jgi:ribose transport system substrate-binding protein